MIVKYEDIIVGVIYVTRGGVVTLPDGVVTGWGYDRVKIIKKFNSLSGDHRVLLQTPWNTELEVSEDYPLEKTTETYVRSEFKLVGRFTKKDTLPFEEAIKKGLCKEEDILPSSTEEIEPEDSDKPSTTRPTKSKKSATESKDIYQKVIDYFSKPQKMVDAAKHFGMQYQKIRYIVMNIKQNGFNLNRFELKTSEGEGKTTFQLVKVTKTEKK